MTQNHFQNLPRLKGQLLKWVGNKQRSAPQIIQHFPAHFQTYYEPFLGSGAVLATLSPSRAVAGDILAPLIDIWQCLRDDPDGLFEAYVARWQLLMNGEDKISAYERIKSRFNQHPNGEDLLFLSRACYGGVVRFRKNGVMSTRCGIHEPMKPRNFARRVRAWHERVQTAEFYHADFQMLMQSAKRGDLVYCDPPYHNAQPILYGAQTFSIERLFSVIEQAHARGVYVALSLNGNKKTSVHTPSLEIPKGLFQQDIYIPVGRSMLQRFKMEGQTLTDENNTERLLLTYA